VKALAPAQSSYGAYLLRTNLEGSDPRKQMRSTSDSFIFTDIATIFVSSEGFRHPYHDFTVRSDL
jgi:hypothetical protein